MQVKLLQWNIDYTEPINEVANYVKSLGADIVCLQELSRDQGRDAGELIGKVLGYDGFYAYDSMNLPDGSSGELGSGVFCRYKLSGSQKISLGSRTYVEVEFEVNGCKLKVGSVHLPLRPSFRSTKNKRNMVDRVLGSVPAGNYILAGDMNATPGSVIIKALRGRLDYAGPAMMQKSWTKKPFKAAGRSFSGLNWRIDHVLYKGRIKVVQAQMLDCRLSDHRPLMVIFEL
jgi:endonuclease/exonuclease/phosphatase family metal-dependent hydrolase